MKRPAPTIDTIAVFAAILPGLLTPQHTAPAQPEAAMPVAPARVTGIPQHMREDSHSTKSQVATCKLWIVWPDGGTFSTYQDMGKNERKQIETWKRKLAPGSRWHKSRFKEAHIYTTQIPGDFRNAAVEKIKP